jgi:hypothetical protein
MNAEMQDSLSQLHGMWNEGLVAAINFDPTDELANRFEKGAFAGLVGLDILRGNIKDIRKGLSFLKATKGTKFDYVTLSKAGQVMDRGGLTIAGRALDKHGNRTGSIFPKATGNAAAKNVQGQFQLDTILTDPNHIIIKDGNKGFKVYSSDGRGAYFLMMELFVGLLRDSMNKRFSVELCSDLDYEEMVVDISLDHNTIAVLNKEKGVENIEIEFVALSESLLELKVPFNDFIDVLLFAKKTLEVD